MHTHTYHKCQLHLSSSSTVETNREYLIRKKKDEGVLHTETSCKCKTIWKTWTKRHHNKMYGNRLAAWRLSATDNSVLFFHSLDSHYYITAKLDLRIDRAIDWSALRICQILQLAWHSLISHCLSVLSFVAFHFIWLATNCCRSVQCLVGFFSFRFVFCWCCFHVLFWHYVMHILKLLKLLTNTFHRMLNDTDISCVRNSFAVISWLLYCTFWYLCALTS